jgi:hypothetical protein
MRSLSLLSLPLIIVGLGLSWACGSDTLNEFDKKIDGGGDPDGAVPGDEIYIPPTPDAGEDDGAACAQTVSQAKLTPVNLVVMFDRSGSMGDTTESASFDPALRWIPVGSALKAFFSDPKSAGMRASLSYFPDVATNYGCLLPSYATPAVPLTALPSLLFTTSINATLPKGDTPTRVAMQGAIAQAQVIAAANPREKTVIVFATDGEPVGCGVDYRDLPRRQAEVTATAADVAAVSATIPTYVIGVGPSVALLNQVAVAGRTTAALQVAVGNPAQTNASLLAALGAIRGNLVECDFDIPTPADGRPIDFNKVAVEFTPSNGPTVKLPYDATCAGSGGFKFDNAAAPKKVVLCKNSCDAAQADGGGKINVAFTCTRQQVVVP